jgi:ATP-dependent RNA helicase DeaD
MTSATFGSLGLSAPILKALGEMGFESPSPIQAATIPLLLAGKDVAGLSKTGSGKTAAFAVPALERVDASVKAPQVLILCPTRELAVQISGEVSKIALFLTGIRGMAIYGGASYKAQYEGLRSGCQIIAGTPGRIMDHLERGSLRLDAIRTVILDEADRMLDMGFRDDIATILDQVPEHRQTAFFSATMPPSVEQLIKSYTRQPEWIRLETRAAAAPNIEQVYYEVSHTGRVGALCRILESSDLRFGIIFCSTKTAVDGVSEHLMAIGYRADRLHGDMSQAMRERVLKRFRERKLEFLVATDVAARGIDVDDVEAVINYDLPRDAEDYVHRIGRTGRAGRSGKAITLATARETYALRRIQRMTQVHINQCKLPSAAEASRFRARSITQTAIQLMESNAFSPDAENLALLTGQPFPTERALGALLHLLVHGKNASTTESRANQGRESADMKLSPRPSYPESYESPLRARRRERYSNLPQGKEEYPSEHRHGLNRDTSRPDRETKKSVVFTQKRKAPFSAPAGDARSGKKNTSPGGGADQKKGRPWKKSRPDTPRSSGGKRRP